MRQQDVMRDISWKIRNWETTRASASLKPEHFGVALGRKSIHGQTTMASSQLVSATPSLVSAASNPTVDPDERLWPRG